MCDLAGESKALFVSAYIGNIIISFQMQDCEIFCGQLQVNISL